MYFANPNKIREIGQCSDHPFVGDWAGISDSYLQGKLNICFRSIDVDSRNYGVLIKSLPLGQKLQPLVDVPGSNKDRSRSDNWIKKPLVFPREVETVQGENKIIPSFVRLETFNSNLIGAGKPLYLFYSVVHWIRESGDVPPNWKVNTFGITYAVALGKSDSQDIKAASDAVNNDPNLGTNDKGNGLHIAKANELLAGVRISVKKEGIGVTCLPFSNSLSQNWEVGYGPINCGFSA